mmetsp:Transcript_61454/g.143059  ORF Transcript_61454/g.143059 Transcript_61454/m.143059 type:complete len:224 (+) Transcript_61454:283-954(+)
MTAAVLPFRDGSCACAPGRLARHAAPRVHRARGGEAPAAPPHPCTATAGSPPVSMRRAAACPKAQVPQQPLSPERCQRHPASQGGPRLPVRRDWSSRCVRRPAPEGMAPVPATSAGTAGGAGRCRTAGCRAPTRATSSNAASLAAGRSGCHAGPEAPSAGGWPTNCTSPRARCFAGAAPRDSAAAFRVHAVGCPRGRARRGWGTLATQDRPAPSAPCPAGAGA